MRKSILLAVLLCGSLHYVQAQTSTGVAPRTLKMEEYEKAKTFIIKDLDNETYAKFDNAWILDRYEMRKPYYITGDDGMKKRIDLYKLIAKDGMQELGTVIYYTTEKGKVYIAVLPGFTADAKIWEKYFEDIHAIDKEEKFYVLKLSYILSKELSFQLYKSMNQGKDTKAESATYGNDICFPGNEEVAMADGSKKLLSTVKTGDQIVTVDPATNHTTVTAVKALVTHEAKNYAITQLLLLSAKEQATAAGVEIKLTSKVLQATPNHPMLTVAGRKKIGEVVAGDQIVCLDDQQHYQTFTVYNKTENAGGIQKVYNIVADGGSTMVMNNVMVMQK